MKNRAGNKGFTLVELLVVISIISLLLTILVPSVSRISKMAYAKKTESRISALQTGISLYYEDTGRRFYPGQQCLKKLVGGDESGNTDAASDPKGTWTGSQWLANAMFTKKDGTFPTNFKQDPGYVGFTDDMLIKPTPDSTDPLNIAISDNFPDPMAICYYVSRPRNEVSSTTSGKEKLSLKQFKELDNDAYTGSASLFDDFITNPMTSGGTLKYPYHDGEYLLIAPGLDRKYFTQDDLKNF